LNVFQLNVSEEASEEREWSMCSAEAAGAPWARCHDAPSEEERCCK